MDQSELRQYREAASAKVLEALQIPVQIAHKTISSILALLLLNLGVTVWLVFYVWTTLSSSLVLAIILSAIAGWPTLAFAYLYVVFKKIIDLPRKVTDFFQGAATSVSGLASTSLSEVQAAQGRIAIAINQHGQKKPDSPVTPKPPVTKQKRKRLFAIGKKLREWYVLGKKLREVKALLGEGQELATITAGAMALANPIVLLVLLVSVLFTAFCAFIGVITMLLHIK